MANHASEWVSPGVNVAVLLVELSRGTRYSQGQGQGLDNGLWYLDPDTDAYHNLATVGVLRYT
jgi:hypothetical protein